MATPVAYECKAPGHQVDKGAPDKLTVFNGQWAFCAFDAKADSHQWMATGGLPLSMLRHSAAMRAREPEHDKTGAK